MIALVKACITFVKHWIFDPEESFCKILNKSFLGLAASVGIPASTLFVELEWWLKIGSLVIGFLVGIATLISLAFTIRYKWIHRNDKPTYENQTDVS